MSRDAAWLEQCAGDSCCRFRGGKAPRCCAWRAPRPYAHPCRASCAHLLAECRPAGCRSTPRLARCSSRRGSRALRLGPAICPLARRRLSGSAASSLLSLMHCRAAAVLDSLGRGLSEVWQDGENAPLRLEGFPLRCCLTLSACLRLVPARCCLHELPGVAPAQLKSTGDDGSRQVDRRGKLHRLLPHGDSCPGAA